MTIECTTCEIDPLAEVNAGPDGALMGIAQAVSAFILFFQADGSEVLSAPENTTGVAFVGHGRSEVPGA